MTAQLVPADAKRAVTEYLTDRLTELAGTLDHPVRVHVESLGLRDMLWRQDEQAWQTKVLQIDTTNTVPVYLYDDYALVGPFGSDRPCFHCLARRWQELRTTEEREVLEKDGAVVVAVNNSPFVTTFGLDAIWQIVRQVVSTPPERQPANQHGHPYVYQLRLSDLAVARCPLVADARCPRCAVPSQDTAHAARVKLHSRTKISVDEFRIGSIESYTIDQDSYANPVCGVAGPGVYPRLVSTTTANARGHIGVAGGGYIHETFWGGHTENYSRSALLGIMEAHERLSGTQPRRFNNFVVDSYRNISARALDPRECGVYTDEFYAETEHYVPYHDDLVVPWVWGYSLRDERPILVPAAITYYHMHDQRNKFIQECSNGCASGSCIEEAVYYGILELIERDAFLIAWFAKQTLPEFDPRSSASVRTRMMIDRIAMYGYDVRMFDARIEFPVPVVIAVAQRVGGGMGALLFSAAASLDPEEAISSSLYEIASEIPTFVADTEAMADQLKAKAADFRKVCSLSDHAPLFGLPEMAHYAEHLLGTGGPPADLPTVADLYHDWQQNERPRTLDLLDDVKFCVEEVVNAGFDVIVVDQTSPEQAELGLCTASVIVPGTLPIDFGWGRQRVLHLERSRTVLRKVGLRDADLDPADLNWAPHPFP